MAGVKKHLIKKTSGSLGLTYVAELSSSGRSLPKMDHLVCFLPGALVSSCRQLRHTRTAAHCSINQMRYQKTNPHDLTECKTNLMLRRPSALSWVLAMPAHEQTTWNSPNKCWTVVNICTLRHLHSWRRRCVLSSRAVLYSNFYEWCVRCLFSRLFFWFGCWCVWVFDNSPRLHTLTRADMKSTLSRRTRTTCCVRKRWRVFSCSGG